MKCALITVALFALSHACQAEEMPHPLPTPEPSNWFYSDYSIDEIYKMAATPLKDMDTRKEAISKLVGSLKASEERILVLSQAYDNTSHACAVAAIISDEIHFIKSLSGNSRWNFGATIMAAAWNLDTVRVDAEVEINLLLQLQQAPSIQSDLIAIHDDLKALHRLSNRLKHIPAETGLEH